MVIGPVRCKPAVSHPERGRKHRREPRRHREIQQRRRDIERADIWRQQRIVRLDGLHRIRELLRRVHRPGQQFQTQLLRRDLRTPDRFD
ncbi:hypothetical protein D3C83_09120 [compost metagenome]